MELTDAPMPARSLPALQLAVLDHLLDGTKDRPRRWAASDVLQYSFSGDSGVTAMGQWSGKNRLATMVSV